MPLSVSSSAAPSITARATAIEKPARANAARSFWRLAARSPCDHGPSRLRHAAFRAAANSSSSLTLLACCASSRPHALRGERGGDGARRAATAPERCSPRLGKTLIVNQPGGDATRDDIIEHCPVRRRVFTMMAAAQRDLARQHPAQLRGRRGIAFEIVHRCALEVIWRDAPRSPGKPCALPSPVLSIGHASRIPASAGRP